MRTRNRHKQPLKKKDFKSVILNQSIFCIILIISVICINSTNANKTNVFIQNVKYSLNTSIDYKMTVQNIKNMLNRIFNERENNDDNEETEQPVTPVDTGETP